VLAVYFGSVNIKQDTRYALACGLFADLVALVGAEIRRHRPDDADQQEDDFDDFVEGFHGGLGLLVGWVSSGRVVLGGGGCSAEAVVRPAT
jgi:hypothetical protein